MGLVRTLRCIFLALALGVVAAPANACTLVLPASAEEAARLRSEWVDRTADHIVRSKTDDELIFIGEVTAIHPAGLAEWYGGPIVLGWKHSPSERVWLTPILGVKGQAPAPFSVYTGQSWAGSTCGFRSESGKGEHALVVAGRPYAGGHWFGEIIGEKDFPDLLPALAKRGLKIEIPVR